jgi:hypothetical protein
MSCANGSACCRSDPLTLFTAHAMNTSTRASFPSANHAHASTAQVPLLRPEGIVMPTPLTSLCQRIAEAYRDALADPSLQIPASPALRDAAHCWLSDQIHRAAQRRIRAHFVDRDVTLSEAIETLDRTVLPGEWRTVPVSTVGNDINHPIWSGYSNLLFRFVHDITHHVTGADDSFDGELATLKHTLMGLDSLSYGLPHFLASEIVGQAAYRITYGSFPKQIIARNILGLIE